MKPAILLSLLFLSCSTPSKDFTDIDGKFCKLKLEKQISENEFYSEFMCKAVSK